MNALLLQSRLNSKRYPRKALNMLGDTTVIEIIMNTLLEVPVHSHILLTNYQSREKLFPLAASSNYLSAWGSNDDVLQRFCDTVRRYRFEHIVRATGDNPFVSADMATSALERYQNFSCDYFAYRNLPIGTGVEIVSSSALLRAESSDTTPYDREHVTPYIYNNPRMFRVVNEDAPSVPRGARDLRVTLDTYDDWHRIQRIFRDMGSYYPVKLEDLLNRCVLNSNN